MEPWRILVADDEPELQKIYRFALEKMGHQVTICRDGEEALATYHQAGGKFDMVLTDYRMPAINGLQLAQVLRLFNPLLPVVIVSGVYGDLRSAVVNGHNITCLQKPLRYGVLEEQILEAQGMRQGQ